MYYSVKRVMEHFEIYDRLGRFVLSADTRNEALKELKELEEAA